MLMQRDFDLNSVQKYADSKEEVVKHTMVKQDMAFRNQVHELHRLYGVQRSLMKDLNGIDDYRYNLWNKSRTSVPTFRNRFDPLVKESITFSETEADFSSYMRHELLKSYQGTSFGLQKRPLNLQLSADEYIELYEDNIPKRGKFVNFLKVAEDPGHFLKERKVDNPSRAQELNLSLSLHIGVDGTAARGATTRNCFSKKVHPSPPIVIDLEDSEDDVSDAYACMPLRCPAPQSKSKGKLDLQLSPWSGALISKGVNVSQSHQNTRSSTYQEYTEFYQEHRSKGTKEGSNNVTCPNVSAEVKQPSYRGYDLDLNRVQTDESSDESRDPILNSLSTACAFGNQAGNNDKNKKGAFPDPSNWQHETRDMVPVDEAVNPAVLNFGSNNGSINSWGTAYNRTNGIVATLNIPASTSVPSRGTSESHIFCDDDKNDDVDQKIIRNNLSPSSDHASAVTTPGADNTIFSCIDQRQTMCQDEHGNKSPASVKSDPISDNNSTNEKTKHCGVNSGVFDQLLETESGTQISDVLSCEHDVQNSIQTESNSEDDKRKAETGEVDVFMEIAAESILHMYFNKASGQDNEKENEERQETMCSADSFEMSVLKLTDEGDDSVTSNAYKVNYEEKKDFGLKLKRGRRMKDFQKEILPGLASLERHEIYEDITILEGAIRSREYRKMRAASGQKWSTPVRSRRSRLNYVRRRIFA